MACHYNVSVFAPDDLIATVRTKLDRAVKGEAVNAIAKDLLACAGPHKRAHVRAFIASEVASRIVTCSAAAGVPGDTLVIGGTTLTNAASPANESEFADAATDALLAASVVACINAHSVLSKIVWAAVTTSASGILTIFAVVPGPIGNLVTLAETGNGFTLGGAALTGGASDEVDGYQLGYNRNAAVAG